MADIYGQVGTVLTPEDIRRAATGEVVLHEEKKEESEVKDGTESSEELEQETRNYRYPLTLTESYPAFIKFTAVEVEGVDFGKLLNLEGLGSSLSSASNLLSRGGGVRTIRKTLSPSEEESESEAENELSDEEKDGLVENLNKAGTALQSHDNQEEGTPVGSVMLPLQRSLQFQDNVQYNTVNLGVSGSAAAAALQGKNPFEGMLGGDGQVTRAAGGLAAAAISKNAVAVLGGAIAARAGGPAAGILGLGALSEAGEGVGNLVKGASRVTSNPNQRTLFEQVGMRSFSFTFKMIANNEQESREIKEIVKFFRQELYPEPITTTSGVQLAYEFPNMFDIEIKNFAGEAPAPKIQRCYLNGVQTNFNSTAVSMHPNGNFVEVEITLNFREITALNKKKVRDGGY